MFESLVRPAQSPSVTPRRRVVAVRAEVTVDPGTLTWGKTGTLPVASQVPNETISYPWGFKIEKESKHQSTKLETEKVKVVNPNDEDQYVVLDRINKVTFREKNAPTLSAYPEGSGRSATVVDPSAPPDPGQNRGETFVATDGSSPPQRGEERVTYPLRTMDREYTITWPPNANDRPL